MVTRYVDSDGGNDTYDGLSPTFVGGTSGPKATLRAAYQISTNGDALLLRRNRFYTPYNGFFSVIKRKNFYIGAYGPDSEPLPVLDGMTWEPATANDWTSEGDGVWSKLFAANITIRRLWTGAFNNGNRYDLRNFGTARLCAKRVTTNTITSIKANLNSQEIWFASGSALSYKLYMYTGSNTIQPPEFYNGLALNCATASTMGANNGLQIQDSVSVVAENIEVWGSTAAGVNIVARYDDTGDTQNIYMRNIISKGAFTNGFKVAQAGVNNATPRKIINNVLIEYCIGDSVSSALEQEPSESYDFLSGATDMFAILDKVKNCKVYRCKSINSGHVAFTIGAYSLNSTIPENSGFEECEMFADSWHTYARGYTAYGCSDTCYITRCLFNGQSVRSQNAGGIKVSSNIWWNMRISTRKANVSNWINISPEILDRGMALAGDDRYVYCEPTNVRIINNLVIDPPQVPIDVQSFLAYGFPVRQPVIADNTVTIANNIIFNRVSTSARLMQVFSNATVVGKIRFIKNVPWVGADKAAPVISVQNVASAINSYVGAVGNMLVDPNIDITNPKNPILQKNSVLRRSGEFVDYVRDVKGRPFMIPPSIGPVEYAGKTPRLATV